MIHIRIPADIRLLMPAQLNAELRAAEEAGPKANIAMSACYEITPAAARTIASMYGRQGEPGQAHLWELANDMQTLPSKVHDEIDGLIENTYGDSSDDVDRLEMLKGWLYLTPTDSPFKIDVMVPLKISSIGVRELIGRYCSNMNGREFKITDVRYDVTHDQVFFDLSDLDDDGNVIPDSESGVASLQSFTLH